MSSTKLPNPSENPVLLNSPFFRDMNDQERNSVLSFMEKVKVKRGNTVFKEGDAGDQMFILLSGSLTAYVSQPDGTQRRMADIKLGDFFGEMSIITNEPRSVTLTAFEDTEVMVLPGIDFYRIVFEFPMVGVKMLKAISQVQNSWLDQTSLHLQGITRWGESARRRAITDELTGLYNRRFFEESVKDRFDQGSVGIRSMSLLMLDLDKIHTINEFHGTQAGDYVLLVFAEVLRSYTRSGDICSRFAEDEFAVFLPDTGLEEAKKIAERIRETIAGKDVLVPRTPDVLDKVKINVHTSIGVAIAPMHAKTCENLFLAADNALRKAKELGRDRIIVAE